MIETVHRRRQIEAVRKALQNMVGSGWQCNERAFAAVAAAEPVLRDSHIPPDDIFADTAIRPEAYYSAYSGDVEEAGERGGDYYYDEEGVRRQQDDEAAGAECALFMCLLMILCFIFYV